jgi:hypothetical protein
LYLCNKAPRNLLQIKFWARQTVSDRQHSGRTVLTGRERYLRFLLATKQRDASINKLAGFGDRFRLLSSAGIVALALTTPAFGQDAQGGDNQDEASDMTGVGGDIFGLDFPLSPQQAALFFGDPTLSFGVQNASLQTLKFDNNGNLVPIDFGSTIGQDSRFNVFTSGGKPPAARYAVVMRNSPSPSSICKVAPSGSLPSSSISASGSCR